MPWLFFPSLWCNWPRPRASPSAGNLEWNGRSTFNNSNNKPLTQAKTPPYDLPHTPSGQTNGEQSSLWCVWCHNPLIMRFEGLCLYILEMNQPPALRWGPYLDISVPSLVFIQHLPFNLVTKWRNVSFFNLLMNNWLLTLASYVKLDNQNQPFSFLDQHIGLVSPCPHFCIQSDCVFIKRLCAYILCK